MTDWQIIKMLFREMHSFKWRLFGALTLYIPVSIFALLQPLIIGAAVERGFRTKDLDQITLWALVYAGVLFFHAFTEMSQLFLMQSSGQGLVKSLRTKLFSKIQRLPVKYFDHTPLGRVLTRVTNDVEAIAELFSSGAVQIVGDLLFLCGTLVMLYLVNIRLSFSATLVFPILLLGIAFFRHWTKEAYNRLRTLIASINSYAQEYISGIGTVQLFGQIDPVLHEYDKKNTEYMLANRKAILLDAGVYSFVDAMSYITIAAVLIWAFGLRVEGALQIGVMVTFVEALNRFFQPIRDLSTNYAVLQSALVAGQRVLRFMDEPEETIEHDAAAANFSGSMAFENVSFSYSPEVPVLHNVSFEIARGQKIALIGHTGAGKTTITKLATRFYDPTAGKITIDGVDLRELPRSSVRSLYNVVLQEVFLFAGTVRDNLRYGRQSASDNDIWLALSLCQARDLVEKRGGLDAMVQARGQNFSLGERQLFAMARALIADPQILILDEATASIDRDTERRLQVATKQVLQHRTALIIAHRLSTITECDKILVFHKGHLVEQGAHKELIELNGIYAKLTELQNLS